MDDFKQKLADSFSEENVKSVIDRLVASAEFTLSTRWRWLFLILIVLVPYFFGGLFFALGIAVYLLAQERQDAKQVAKRIAIFALASLALALVVRILLCGALGVLALTLTPMW